MLAILGTANAGVLQDVAGILQYDSVNVCLADGSIPFNGFLNNSRDTSTPDFEIGVSNYIEGFFININNSYDDPGNIANTFVMGFNNKIENHGDSIKPFGFRTEIDQYSEDTNADSSGIVIDMELLGNSNSTLKGTNINLVDNGNPSLGLRGNNIFLEKTNSNSFAYGNYIASSGSQPINSGIYLTGGGGFTNGFHIDSLGDIAKGIYLHQSSAVTGSQAIYTEGGWDYDIYLNSSSPQKILANEILELRPQRSSSGEAYRIFTKDIGGTDTQRFSISSNVADAVTDINGELQIDGELDLNGNAIMIANEASNYMLDIRNTDSVVGRHLIVKNSSGSDLITVTDSNIRFFDNLEIRENKLCFDNACSNWLQYNGSCIISNSGSCIN